MNNKYRNMIKVLLIALINKDKEIFAFSKTLQNNNNLYKFVVEPNEIIPFEEISKALELQSEKECQKMYDELYKIALSKKKSDEQIEEFMTKYGL